MFSNSVDEKISHYESVLAERSRKPELFEKMSRRLRRPHPYRRSRVQRRISSDSSDYSNISEAGSGDYHNIPSNTINLSPSEDSFSTNKYASFDRNSITQSGFFSSADENPFSNEECINPLFNLFSNQASLDPLFTNGINNYNYYPNYNYALPYGNFLGSESHLNNAAFNNNYNCTSGPMRRGRYRPY